MMYRGLSLAIILSVVFANGSGECHAGDHHCENTPRSTSLLQVSGLGVAKPMRASGSQLMRDGSLHLSRHFALAAKKLPAASVTKSLLETFRVCAQCNNFVRFGEAYDGGYLTCMDGLQNGSVQAVYSLGVEQHDLWSEQVGKALSAPVNQFDCTVASSSCNTCSFFKKCIVSADGSNPVPGHAKESWSLKEALEHTSQGNAADGTLLMKMDIESSEWPVYASEPRGTLRKFGQILVEFHDLASADKHPHYLKAMQNILGAGFQVAHLHGNNYQGMYLFGENDVELSIPRVLEVTFVTKSPKMPSGCLEDQIYNPLDAPNEPGTPELPMARLA